MQNIAVRSLSWSTVTAFILCPDKVWLDKIMHRPKHGVASQLVMGTAVHAAAAAWFLSLKANRPIDINVCENIICNRVYAETDIIYPAGEDQESLIVTARGLIATLIDNGPPIGTIVGVEVPIRFKLTHDLWIVGQADLLTRNANGRLVVTDLKTSARLYADDDCRKVAEQTKLYSCGFDEPVDTQAMVLIKTKTPKMQTFDLRVFDVDLYELRDKILGVRDCLEAGIHWKQRSWACATCQFADECRKSHEVVDAVVPYSLAA